MKKIILLCVFLVGILSGYSVSATTSNDKMIDLYDTSLKQEYLLDEVTNEKIFEAYRTDEDGEMIEISLEEYKEILDNMEGIEVINNEFEESKQMQKSPMTWKVYRYSGEKGKSKVNGQRVKVSPDVKGPGSITSGYSTTISNSFGGSIAGTIGNSIKKSASFTWTTSASTTKNFSTTFSIPKGKTGYIGFTPYLNKTWGTGYEDTMTQTGKISTKNLGTVYGISPKKLKSGLADGLYAVVYK